MSEVKPGEDATEQCETLGPQKAAVFPLPLRPTARNTRMLRYHLAMIRKAQDHVDQAVRCLEASGERPKAFFPHSPMHKAVTADHIVPESPVLGEMRDVIERWSEAGGGWG